MNLKALRLAADFAAHRQHLRYDQLKDAWRPWWIRLRPTDHPGSMLAASFAVGALIARVPGTVLLGSASTVLGIASFFLRSPVSSLVVAAIATARTKKPGKLSTGNRPSADSRLPLRREPVG